MAIGKTNAVSGKPTQSKTVTFNPGSADSITIAPDSGYVLNSVQVNKPATMIPDNIKKDIDIGGVVGTYEGNVITYWDGTYIEPDLFNVTLNTTNYTVKGGSTFYYSTDGGATYNQIMGTGTINLSDVYQLDFKLIKPDSSSNKFQTIVDIGTTEGGSEISRTVLPSALTAYFEKNIGNTITVSADSYYYISIQQS